MIKFEEGERYWFKAADLTNMVGECIERNYLSEIEYLVFRFPEKGLNAKCYVKYEMGDYTMGDYDDNETVLCTLGDKLFMANSRWVAE